MGKGLLAFAAGFGTGYLNQTKQNKIDAERQEDRDQVKRENAERQEERDRVKRERTELAEAGKLATVNQGAAVVDGLSTQPVVYEDADVAQSDLRQDKRLRASSDAAYSEAFDQATATGAPPPPEPAPAAPTPTLRQSITVNGKEQADLATAEASAKTLNDGRNKRISDTLTAQGRPDTAIGLEAADLKLSEAKRENARKLVSEGLIDVATASRNGSAQGVMDAMNKQGDYKLTEVPTVTEVVRDLPGLGKQKTFDYEITMVGKDGKEVKKTVNSHQLTMMAFDAKQQLEFQLKADASEASKAYKEGLYDLKNKDLERRERQLELGVGAGGIGAGAGGKKGKAPAALIDQAQELLADQLGKADGTPEMALRNTKAVQTLDGIYKSHPEVSPRTAAFIAADISSDQKTKLRPQLDSATGVVSQVYQNPEVEQGKTYVIAKNSGSIKDIEAAYGKEGVQAAVQGVLGAMGTPEQQAQFLRAAHDPAYRKAMVAAAKDQGADLTVLQRKLDLLINLPRPAATGAEGAPTKAAPGSSLGAKGGITPAGYNFMLAPRVKYLEDKQRAGRTPLTPQEAAELQQRRAARDDKAGRNTGWFGEDLGN